MRVAKVPYLAKKSNECHENATLITFFHSLKIV